MDRFETFAGSVLELNRYVQKLKELEMQPFGLRGNHVMCLYSLGKTPEGMTVTQLASTCREDKAAVSRCVAQLLERGFICGDFRSDRRSYRTKLMLTDSGRELVGKIDARVDAALIGGGSGLTQQQREIFYSAMEMIMNNLRSYLAEREG